MCIYLCLFNCLCVHVLPTVTENEHISGCVHGKFGVPGLHLANQLLITAGRPHGSQSWPSSAAVVEPHSGGSWW